LAFVSILSIIILIKIYIDYNNINSKALIEEEEETLNKKSYLWIKILKIQM